MVITEKLMEVLMENKKQVSRKYFMFYLLTILFSIIYGGIFLALSIMIAFTSFFLFDVYLIPACIGSIRIIFALLPRINLKKSNRRVYSENCFIENTERIASAMKSTYPKSIYVMYDANACAFNYKGEEVIAIGFPLVILLNKSELSFIIGHEIAHHFQGDVRYGKYIHKVELVFTRLMNTLNNRWLYVLAGPYIFVAKKIFKEIKKFSRQDEFNADLRAAEIIGKQPAIYALKKLEISNRSWNFYLSSWIWILNEYKLYVDIVENFSLFVSLLDIDPENMNFVKKAADEYDSHPTVYERITEIENTCVESTAIIENEEYNIDSTKLSKHFWNIYNPETIKDLDISIVKNSGEAMEDLAKKMSCEYKDIFASYTYSDAKSMMSIYSKVSYNLYQKTQNDNFEFEAQMITRILSFIIYMKVKPENWRIGAFFTPVLITGEEEIDLYSIIIDSFNNKCTRWDAMLNALNINDQELISEIDCACA